MNATIGSIPWQIPILIALGRRSIFMTIPMPASTRSLCADARILTQIFATSNNPVSTADGMPTAKMPFRFSFSIESARLSLMLSGAPFDALRYAKSRYAAAAVLDSVVAIAAPVTSFPGGRITNMKSGSRIILRTPPAERPMLACAENPALRRRCASVMERTLGRLPMTTTIIA